MRRQLPPPRYLNLLFLLVVGLHLVFPAPRLLYYPVSYSGIGLILLGVILNLWSVSHLKRRRTTVEFNETSNKLVMDGPFRWSRNPIYLSGVILILGTAVLLGSLIIFALSGASLLVLDRLYVPAEEAELEGAFGEEYLDYKRSVGRWI